MRKVLYFVACTGLLFAQSNVVSSNNFNTNGGDVNINQSNTISNEEIEINKKLMPKLLNYKNQMMM